MSPIGYDKEGWPVLYPDGAQIPLNLPRSKSQTTRRVELSGSPQTVQLPDAVHPDPRGVALTTNEAAKLLGLPLDEAQALMAECEVPRYAAWSRLHVQTIAETRAATRGNPRRRSPHGRAR